MHVEVMLPCVVLQACALVVAGLPEGWRREWQRRQLFAPVLLGLPDDSSDAKVCGCLAAPCTLHGHVGRQHGRNYSVVAPVAVCADHTMRLAAVQIHPASLTVWAVVLCLAAIKQQGLMAT
jgi:hypothetical protein